MDSIKTRESFHSIKSKDMKSDLMHYQKDGKINTRENFEFKNEEGAQSKSASSFAISDVQKSVGITTYGWKRKSDQVRNKIKENYKAKKEKEINSKNHSIKERQITTVSRDKKDGKKTVFKSVSKDKQAKINKGNPNVSYGKRMQNLFIQKAKTSIQTLTVPRKQVINKGFKTVINVIKKTFGTVSNLVSIGSGIVLVVVTSMFIGCFSVLASENNIIPSYIPLSEEVLAYRTTIEHYCDEYNIEEYVSIIMAIMMQESGGRGNDPMQCSESGYNTRYPRVPNGITDPDYSIKIGVKTFASCIDQAGLESPSNTEKLSLALQGYNYGGGYISWAITNFGGYTKANARVFSDNKKAQLGTDVYGDPDYVDHVLRYVSLGFGSLRSQPNFSNSQAWGYSNPFSGGWQGVLQCTYFAWGRFYETYGYDSGARGNGFSNVREIVAAHPDKFVYSTTPAAGAVYSCGQGGYAYSEAGHVGFVVAWDGQTITVQDGNVSGLPGTQTVYLVGKVLNWCEQTMSWAEFQRRFPNGLCFAVPR